MCRRETPWPPRTNRQSGRNPPLRAFMMPDFIRRRKRDRKVALVHGSHGAAQPTGFGHCICQGTIVAAPSHLRGGDLPATVLRFACTNLWVHPPKLAGRESAFSPQNEPGARAGNKLARNPGSR